MMNRRLFLGTTAASVLIAASPRGNSFSLASKGISATWSLDDGIFRMVALRDLIGKRAIVPLTEIFTLTFADGSSIKASECTPLSGPTIDGHSVRVGLRHASTGTNVSWRAIAKPNTDYLRCEIAISAEKAPLQVRDVELVSFRGLPDALVVGYCDGSPIVSGNLFVALEHPFAQGDGVYDRANLSLPRKVDIQPHVPLTASMVIGATRPGELRRGFLEYIESERAHPYRPFLHYNSWYDIGYFEKYEQSQCLDRIHAFGESLVRKRNVRMQSFLFDDGWDNPDTTWQFNDGFPNGFAPLKAAAAQYRAAPGAWLSPWGGYGKPHAHRVAAAKAGGYETNANGMALSGPKYYARFHDVVMSLIENGGVNQFKIDGTGSDANVIPGSAFGSDFEAAIALIGSMRAAEPNVYVNLTTGTYPSPFWLRYCDSIWRGGYDHNFEGAGTHRQKWITYRDSDTYTGVVTQGPLYPLNSLMLHGLIYAQHAKHLNDDPHDDFRDEIHSYFGTGTQLQEMYVTPALLRESNWNDIAQAAAWSARNAMTLRDTHWVGGHPGRGEVYGWGAWSPHRGILTLRNPSDRPQSIDLDIGQVFELPESAQRSMTLTPAFDGRTPLTLRAGREHRFDLQPFEVAVLETT